MSSLNRLWAGRLFGTNTGNMFVELTPKEAGLDGVVRVNDTTHGVAVYAVTGTFEDGRLRISGAATKLPPGVESGDITATAVLTSEGSLRGEWSSTIGTGGTFEIFPHDTPEADQTKSAGAVPEELHTAHRQLGAIQLYAEDVRGLIQFIRKDFRTGRVVVTYAVRENELTKYSEDFEAGAENLGELRYLKMRIQEPEAHGINRLVEVQLDALGTNDVRVQGIQESWVVGKSEAIARYMQPFERSLVTNYKKFGLTINQAILLTMLVLVPEIQDIIYRALFVGLVLLLLSTLGRIHARVIPNVSIHMGPRRPNWAARVWPSVLSWLIAATSALAAAYAFYRLTGERS